MSCLGIRAMICCGTTRTVSLTKLKAVTQNLCGCSWGKDPIMPPLWLSSELFPAWGGSAGWGRPGRAVEAAVTLRAQTGLGSVHTPSPRPWFSPLLQLFCHCSWCTASHSIAVLGLSSTQIPCWPWASCSHHPCRPELGISTHIIPCHLFPLWCKQVIKGFLWAWTA